MEILIIGGDKRQYYMAKFLDAKGFAVSYFGELYWGGVSVKQIHDKEKLFTKLDMGLYESVVLPIPVGQEYIKGCPKKLKLAELAGHLGKVKRIYGGNIPNAYEHLPADKVDFLKNEAFLVENAELTAENAIVEAMLISELGFCGSKSLIIGYGRCGQMLASRLKGLKSQVEVAELDESKRSLAKSYGIKVAEIGDLSAYDFIFQTAPGFELDKKEMLSCISEEKEAPIIIDISSMSALDMSYGQSIGILMKKCAGLPGRYTAKTAGRLLGEFVKKKEDSYGNCG